MGEVLLINLFEFGNAVEDILAGEIDVSGLLIDLLMSTSIQLLLLVHYWLSKKSFFFAGNYASF